MLPNEFCAFLKGFFEITEASRTEKSKPLALKPEQVAIIQAKLATVINEPCKNAGN